MTEQIRFHTMADKTRAYEKRRRHKTIAAEIRKRPELVEQALTVLNGMADQPQVAEWRELLQQPPHTVAAEIVKLTQKMDQMRIDSPFMFMRDFGLDFTDEGERRELSRAARLEAEEDPSDVLMWRQSR